MRQGQLPHQPHGPPACTKKTLKTRAKVRRPDAGAPRQGQQKKTMSRQHSKLTPQWHRPWLGKSKTNRSDLLRSKRRLTQTLPSSMDGPMRQSPAAYQSLAGCHYRPLFGEQSSELGLWRCCADGICLVIPQVPPLLSRHSLASLPCRACGRGFKFQLSEASLYLHSTCAKPETGPLRAPSAGRETASAHTPLADPLPEETPSMTRCLEGCQRLPNTPKALSALPVASADSADASVARNPSQQAWDARIVPWQLRPSNLRPHSSRRELVGACPKFLNQVFGESLLFTPVPRLQAQGSGLSNSPPQRQKSARGTRRDSALSLPEAAAISCGNAAAPRRKAEQGAGNSSNTASSPLREKSRGLQIKRRQKKEESAGQRAQAGRRAGPALEASLREAAAPGAIPRPESRGGRAPAERGTARRREREAERRLEFEADRDRRAAEGRPSGKRTACCMCL